MCTRVFPYSSFYLSSKSYLQGDTESGSIIMYKNSVPIGLRFAFVYFITVVLQVEELQKEDYIWISPIRLSRVNNEWMSCIRHNAAHS